MIKYYIIFLLTLCFTGSQAQQINGYVLDLVSSDPIWNAEIKNLRTNQVSLTDKDGAFQIDGKINDYLAVNVIGYTADTIFYYDEAIRRVYLNKDENVLHIDEVLVKRLTDNLLAKELEKAINAGKIVEVPRDKGGIKISPSRLLGREAKQARNNIEILKNEQNERIIDQKFTKHLISSLLPLNQSEISLFRERFRPTVEFIQNSSEEDLKVYIIESFAVFKNN